MLSQDERVETYFDVAPGYLDLNVVGKNPGLCGFLNSQEEELENVHMSILRVPRINDEWKAKLN